MSNNDMAEVNESLAPGAGWSVQRPAYPAYPASLGVPSGGHIAEPHSIWPPRNRPAYMYLPLATQDIPPVFTFGCANSVDRPATEFALFQIWEEHRCLILRPCSKTLCRFFHVFGTLRCRITLPAYSEAFWRYTYKRPTCSRYGQW